MDSTVLRIGILVAGLLLLGAIYFFGRPRKPGQGRRVAQERGDGPRIEPTLAGASEPLADSDAVQSELDLHAQENELGRRAVQQDTGRYQADFFTGWRSDHFKSRGNQCHAPSAHSCSIRNNRNCMYYREFWRSAL